ncbi:MAG: GNAT family N-acetyltransferase [Treponema sp.]|nr:GNAT family N-acetyltransferase [Treponema sp.]
MSTGQKFQLKIHSSIQEIPKEEWNRLVSPDAVPFLDWDWLYILEKSGSVSPDMDWHPLHFCLWDQGQLAAAAPLYLRTSSGGEYLHDYFWAEAVMSIGKAWYPKMVGAPACTPAEGYRFLAAPELDLHAATVTLLESIETLCTQNQIPSVNLIWADPQWSAVLPSLGYMAWDHNHLVWENENFSSFDDYLALFSKNQRKNIRKEYARHKEQGISIKVVPGTEATEEHYSRMFEFYTITNDMHVPWDARWFNEEWFILLEQHCRHSTAFSEARLDSTGEIIAMAILIHKGDRIWGRFWGAFEDIRDLHFAVCYYAPMDWCIEKGIRYFDPGAGASSHKLRRGFKAQRNRSYHKFFDPIVTKLFRDNIKAINRRDQARRDSLNELQPYKKETD